MVDACWTPYAGGIDHLASRCGGSALCIGVDDQLRQSQAGVQQPALG